MRQEQAQQKKSPPLSLVAAALRYKQTSAPQMWLTDLLRPGTYCKTLQLAHNKDWLTFLTSVLILKGYCEVAEAASCDSKLDSTRRLQIPTIPLQFHFLTRSTELRAKCFPGQICLPSAQGVSCRNRHSLGLETLAVVICCWRVSCLHAPAARSLQLLHYQTHIKLSSKDHLFFEFDRVFVLACGR